ncbi:MAG TPA: bifunctional molybdenum cofactor biosynthesis protein MoaC/MoaB [Candidatus Bathyarchaeia archaeon]|nr:bifunctional molybdenum cofactor biosynthesis protein MoaC/MoaB [Candidatus Bathyarchaeia archaeon]
MVGMFDVSDKSETLRTAVAQAIIKVEPTTVTLIKEGKSPKGSIFDAARLSATMAAKRAWDLLPYCHPIPIDSINADVSLKEQSIEVTVEVKNVAKTGVEMEALTGACIAALTIYDMLKPVDEMLSIESVRVLKKHGGLKTFIERFDRKLKAAVLVTSDSRGEDKDESGKIVIDRLVKNGFDIVEYKVISDEADVLESQLKTFSDELKVDMVITSGGTGLGPRDITPETTKKVIQKEVSGVSEFLRAYGQKRTPLSMLSRGVAGIRGTTVIINLPGSVKAVSESLDSLFPGIMHIYKMLWGQGH